MKKVGLFVKKDKKAARKADEFESWLKKKQIDVVRKESSPPQIHSPAPNKNSASRDLSCVFVLGGDGTFLSAVRWIGNSNIPVLGIKFGEVGFMAEVAEERASIIDREKELNYWSRRLLLCPPTGRYTSCWLAICRLIGSIPRLLAAAVPSVFIGSVIATMHRHYRPRATCL